MQTIEESSAETQNPADQADSLSPFRELSLVVEDQNPDQYIFRFTDTGIDIRQDMEWEEYRDGLRFFKDAKARLAMGFAKYVQFGHLRFGREKVDGQMAQLHFDLNDTRRALDIISVPQEIISLGVSPEHCVVLARSGAKRAEQVKWAKIATEQKLTPTQLKQSIEAGEVVTTNITGGGTSHGIASIHGIRAELDIWLRRVGGLEGILKMEPAAQKDIMAELQPIVDLGVALDNAIKSGKKGTKKASKRPAKAPKAQKGTKRAPKAPKGRHEAPAASGNPF